MEVFATRNLLAVADRENAEERLFDLRFNRVTLQEIDGTSIYSGSLSKAIRMAGIVMRAHDRLGDFANEASVPLWTREWNKQSARASRGGPSDWVAVFKDGDLVWADREAAYYEALEGWARGGDMSDDAMLDFALNAVPGVGADAVMARSEMGLVLKPRDNSLRCALLDRSYSGNGKVTFSLPRESEHGGYPMALHVSADLIDASTMSTRIKAASRMSDREAARREEAWLRGRLKEVRQRIQRLVGQGAMNFWPEAPHFLAS